MRKVLRNIEELRSLCSENFAHSNENLGPTSHILTVLNFHV